MKESYKAYSRGWRAARRYKRYCYIHNPYKIQLSSWYSFNIGWNDYLKGINLYNWNKEI